jgi:AraC-like DNA-binding protein
MRMTKYYIQIVTSAKMHMDDHPLKHFTVEDLGLAVNCGASMLHRAFKQQYNITIYAYQLSQRLELARQFILDEEDSLKVIAAETGFKKLSHFSAAFKKKFGVSPAQYRASGFNR